jgi:hypothetical protein
MREYLLEFFKDFAYDQADADYLLEVYDRVMANNETRALWQEGLAMYENNINCDFKAVLALAAKAAGVLYLHPYTTELLMSVCLSRRLKQEYEARGLAPDIYHNSMLDIKYKLEECKLVKGVIGSFVAFWFDRFFNLTRFALGRLQFEMVDLGNSYEKDGLVLTPESRVINIHIPRTMTPLDESSCDEAFARAKAFFADQTGDVCVFLCHSWLLFPEHEHMLSHESNVYKFMKRFDIFRSGTSRNREDLWRLFDTDEKRWDKLPADSSLRRAYVKQLSSGRQVGWGRGVFVYE